MIIDLPGFEDVRAHVRRAALPAFLEGRFGSVPEELQEKLRSIESDKRSRELTSWLAASRI